MGSFLRPALLPFVAGLAALIFLLAVRRFADVPDKARHHWLLLFGIVIVPGVALALGLGMGLEYMKRPQFCGSCHVMGPFIADLQNPDSSTLAAVHYQNRYIREHQCYTCHADYGLFGPLRAKLAGVRHLLNYETGNYEIPIRIREPYHETNCLHCHGEAKVFRDKHEDMLEQLISGDMSCLDCHRPAHAAQQARR